MRPSISAFLPAPSMIVVLSLSTTIRLARPRSWSVTFSSLMPSSSAITLPPVRIAMSSSMALRRSPKPGALTAAQLQRAAELVDHQRRQRLALDVLGHEQERLAGLGDRLENRQQVLHRRNLLLVDEDVGVLELRLHPLRVGDEVGREIAAVELHALDHFERGLQALGLLDRDHAFLADLLHRLGDDVADGGVVVGRDGADLGDFAAVLGRLGEVLELADDGRRPRGRCRA